VAIRVRREVNRSEGRLPASGVNILAGQAVMIDGDGKFTNFADAGSTLTPYGLADVSNVTLPLAGSDGVTVGQGYDYTNFARGGLVGAFLNGGEFSLFDDGRGKPFIDTDTYLVNGKVYVVKSGADTGKITSVAVGPEIGTVVEVTGSPVDTLVIKVTL